MQDFDRAVKGPGKMYQAELVSRYQQIATVGGRVILPFLTKGNGACLKFPIDNTIDREIMVQKIPTDNEEFIKEYGEDVELNTISILVKKKYLKIHEARRIMKKEHKSKRRRGEEDDD